jgi:hypothetical protein
MRALENTKLCYFIEAGAKDNIPKKVSRYEKGVSVEEVQEWLDWSADDSCVRTIIINNCKEIPRKVAEQCTTARSMWLALEA